MTIAIIILIVIAAGISALIVLQKIEFSQDFGFKSSKDPETMLRNINKRLAKDPRDPSALYALSDMQFREENWEKAFQTYGILGELIDGTQKFDAFEVYLNYGKCALKLGLSDVAYKAFSDAWNIKKEHFEVNYALGYFEYQQKNYEKAVQYFSTARKQNEEDFYTLRYLSFCFFNMLKFNEAITYIRKAIEVDPTDKESMFILGKCYSELGQMDHALKIFIHLRSDPTNGPKASLLAGNIHLTQFKEEAAIEDFEFGLRHKDIDLETLSELRYQLSIAYIKQNEIGKAITYLQAILADNENYKDVKTLVSRYEDLNRNKNLQLFMLGSSSDFVGLCRKMVLGYFSAKAKVKITNVLVNRSDSVDISTSVETAKWSDIVVFRFIKTQGSVGELTLRDFHARLKEMKGGKGVCITMGTFTEEARRYTETRLIDLLEKDQLLTILAKVDAKINVIQTDSKAIGVVKEESIDDLTNAFAEGEEETEEDVEEAMENLETKIIDEDETETPNQ